MDVDVKKIEIKDLEKIATNLIKMVGDRLSDGAVVITLSGDLGSGKTTLTQTIGKQLGIKNKIISPTFVIMKKYPLKNKKFKELIHIDTYRLEKKEDIIHLGWEKIISENGNLVIVEWPELIEELIPQNAIKIKLVHIDEKTRGIDTEID